MHIVYLIKSLATKKHHYVGFTDNLKLRLQDHNNGSSIYTKMFKPWELICYTAFKDNTKAKEFEKYLKSGSGRAFLKRHLLS